MTGMVRMLVKDVEGSEKSVSRCVRGGDYVLDGI